MNAEGEGYIGYESTNWSLGFDIKTKIRLCIVPETSKLIINMDEPDIETDVDWLAVFIVGILFNALGLIVVYILKRLIEEMIEEQVEDVQLFFPIEIPAIPGIPMEARLTEIKVFNDGTTSRLIVRGTFIAKNI